MPSQKQIKGTKFEIWLELILKKTGDQNVRRNITIRPIRNNSKISENWKTSRQIDIVFNYISNNKIHTAFVEAKYLDRGIVPYYLRGGNRNKENSTLPNINNIVDEVYERQLYCNANTSFIVTNLYFDKNIKKNAPKYGIKIIERESIKLLWNKSLSLGIINDYQPWKNINKNSTIEDYIRAINLRDFDTRSDLMKRYNY
jgi:hypothetical protein